MVPMAEDATIKPITWSPNPRKSERRKCLHMDLKLARELSLNYKNGLQFVPQMCLFPVEVASPQTMPP